MAKRDTMLDEWVEIVRACLAEGKSYQEIAEREKKELERGGREVEPSLVGKRISKEFVRGLKEYFPGSET